jgi:hypothetical protein
LYFFSYQAGCLAGTSYRDKKVVQCVFVHWWILLRHDSCLSGIAATFVFTVFLSTTSVHRRRPCRQKEPSANESRQVSALTTMEGAVFGRKKHRFPIFLVSAGYSTLESTIRRHRVGTIEGAALALTCGLLQHESDEAQVYSGSGRSISNHDVI